MRTPVRPFESTSMLAAVSGFLLLSASGAVAESWREDFASDPRQGGWKTWGNGDLFDWDASGRLNVSWDTTNRHTFFARPLGVTLTRADEFAFSFDLALEQATGGVREGRPGAMQVAVGLLNWDRAQSEDYRRGAGQAKDTLEFNWFPAGFIPGFGDVEPTLSLVAFDGAGRVRANFDFPFEWNFSQTMQVEVVHRASEKRLTLTARRGTSSVTVPLALDDTFGPLELDTFAVLVWDESTSFGDSLRANGWLDNVVVTWSDPPIGEVRWVSEAVATVEFNSLAGWRYSLEASGDLHRWDPIDVWTPGTGGALRLSDFREALFPKQFYRVRAEQE